MSKCVGSMLDRHPNVIYNIFYQTSIRKTQKVAVVMPPGGNRHIANAAGKQAGADAVATSLSSFCAVSNALRLNLYNMHDPDAANPFDR